MDPSDGWFGVCLLFVVCCLWFVVCLLFVVCGLLFVVCCLFVVCPKDPSEKFIVKLCDLVTLWLCLVQRILSNGSFGRIGFLLLVSICHSE